MLAGVAAHPRPAPSLPSRPGSYTRTCAYADDRFEVLLLDWWPGAASEIHDHGGQHCWFVVLQGTLARRRLRPRRCAATIRATRRSKRAVLGELGRGDLDVRSGRFDIHRVAASQRARGDAARVLAPVARVFVYDRARTPLSTGAQHLRSGAFDF